MPFSNRIRDGRFIWDGTEYRIAVTEKNAPHAIHGHGRVVSWAVDTLADTYAALSYACSGEDWPSPVSAVAGRAGADSRVRFDLVGC